MVACSEVGLAFFASLFVFVQHMEQVSVCFFVRFQGLLLIRYCLQAFGFALAYGNELLMCLLGVPFLQGRRTASCFAPCTGPGLYSTLPTLYTWI